MERRGRAKQFRFADSPQIEPLEVHDAGVTSLRLGPDSESRQERGLSRLAVALDREGGAGLPEVVEDRLVDLPHRVANREPGATGRPPTGGAGGGGGPGVGGPEHSATNWRTPSWIGLDRRRPACRSRCGRRSAGTASNRSSPGSAEPCREPPSPPAG